MPKISPEQKENCQETWIKMRDTTTALPHKEKYRLVVWEPRFIYQGNRLEINVQSFNLALKALEVNFPVEIKPYNSNTENETRISMSSISPNGEATISSVASKNKRPKSQFHYDPTSKQGFLLIDFQQTADLIESSLLNGKNNPKYYETFGLSIDGQIREQFGRIAFTSYLVESLKNSALIGENFAVGLSSLGTLAFIIVTQIIDIPQQAWNRIPENIVISIGSFTLAWLGIQLELALMQKYLDNDPKALYSNYGQHVWQVLNEKRWKEFLYPTHFDKHFIRPMLQAKKWNSPLIRGV